MKRYDAYKSTGIPWIPEVPEHWEMRKLRHFIEMISEKNHPQEPLLSVVRDQGVILRDITSKEENHNAIPDDLSGYKLIEKGHFAINKMKAWQGSYGVSSYRGIVSPAYYTCRLNFEHKAYFNLAIRSDAYVPFFTQYSKGIRVGQWDLSPIGLKEIPFFLPPLSEQRAIVAYIERKERQIDTYIARQAEQIERLKELRQTIISHAVTRGIHPYTRFRPTGIPWIPEVPEHWEMRKLRHFIEIISEKNHPQEPLLSVVRDQGVILRDITSKEENHNAIPDDLSGYKLIEKGHFAINKMKAWQGSYGVSSYRGIVSPAYYTCRLNFEHKAYFNLAIRSDAYVPFFTQYSKGIRVGQWDLSPIGLKEIPFFLPPLSEQHAIVAYIEKKTTAVDRMINACREQTELMKAYKQRLISDAVTGHINVLPHD